MRLTVLCPPPFIAQEAFYSERITKENPFMNLGGDDSEFSRILNAVQNSISKICAAGCATARGAFEPASS